MSTTVKLINNSASAVTVAGLTFDPGDNDIEDTTLKMLAELDLIGSNRFPYFDYDLSALEP